MAPKRKAAASKSKQTAKKQKKEESSGTKKKPPTLLTIAPELRNRIYREVVLSNLGLTHRSVEPGLLRTCRQIRKEARPMYYLHNSWHMMVHGCHFGQAARIAQRVRSLEAEHKPKDPVDIFWHLFPRDPYNHDPGVDPKTKDAEREAQWERLLSWCKLVHARKIAAIPAADNEICDGVYVDEEHYVVVSAAHAIADGMHESSWDSCKNVLNASRLAWGRLEDVWQGQW